MIQDIYKIEQKCFETVYSSLFSIKPNFSKEKTLEFEISDRN